jgi:hypothetical protein
MRETARAGRAKSLREALCGPWSFAAIGAAYIAACMISSLDPAIRATGVIIEAAPVSIAVFAFGLLSLCLGIVTAKKALILGPLPIIGVLAIGTIVVSNISGLHPAIALGLNLAALLTAFLFMKSKVKLEWAFAAGALIFWANFAAGGMPALDLALHSELLQIVNPVFMAGFFLMLYSAAMMSPQRRLLWLFLVISLALSTFRLYAGIALITWLLIEVKGWKSGSVSARKRKFAKLHLPALVILCAAALFGFILIGHGIITASHQQWKLDPLRTFEHRLAFTAMVFDDVVQISFPFGHSFGASLSMEPTEYTCRLLYGNEGPGCRVTSTSFGEAMLNFGLPGVFLIAWFAGAVLACTRKENYKIYAILLATLIATIDVGINAMVLMELAYLGWLAVIIAESEKKTQEKK